MRYDNILDLIGNTPLVRVGKDDVERRSEIYIKLEKFNPGGSVKDRIAKAMIEMAEKEGDLTPGKTIIEPTSGNTGIGLAIVSMAKGYRLTLVMPETMTEERRQMLISLGAKIILTDGEKGMDGAEDLAREMAEREPGRYFMPDQFRNRANVMAHYETTAREIIEDTGGNVTHFVAGLGTTGTITGVSRRLKEHDGNIRIIGVQPEEGASIQGLKNLEHQYVPGIWDPGQVDEIRDVSQSEAEEMSLLLAFQEGIFVGPSSGAIFGVARDLARNVEDGVIVMMAPDGGEKYFSMPLCDPERCMSCIKKYGVMCSYSDGKPISRA